MISRTNAMLIAVLTGMLAMIAAPALAQDEGGMTPEDRELQEDLLSGKVGATTIDEEVIPLHAYDERALAAHFNNQTNRYVVGDDGSRIFFTASDGRLYLWQRDHHRVIRGQWRTDRGTHLCYNYPREHGQLFLEQTERGWFCEPISLMLADWVEGARGDVFGLSRYEQVPFLIRRDNTQTLAELGERASRRATRATVNEVNNDADMPEAAEEEREERDEGPWWRRILTEDNSDRDETQEDIFD